MATEKELMLKQADAETIYQKKLTAGTNITIDPVTNVISSAGGGSTVQYTDNTPNGESVGILAINGQSHPVRIPKLAEGSGITISKNITNNVYTISLSGGGGGTTKTYMGKTDPDELVGEDGDLYFKYHKIETDIPTELTLPSLPDDATVPFPITNFNSYDSFTFYYTDGNMAPHNKKVNIGDIVISDNPVDAQGSNIYTWNSYRYVQATRSTNGEGLVLRVCGNCLYKLEANVTEVDLGIDKSYAKVEDTWLPSGEQVEANPEETSETPLTKIKIDGVTYYIAAGGSAEIVPLTKAEWDALPASKYTDNILYLITDSFTTDTIITPNPEGEATDTLTKLQIDETIYSLAGGSGAAAIEKTQSEYNALTPAQKENGAIYMVQDDGTGDYEYHTNQAETIVVRVNKTTNEIEWFFVDYTFTGGSVEQIPSELMAYLPASTISGNAYDISLQTMMGYVAINAQGGFGLYPTDYSREIAGTVKCLLKNTDGTEQANTYTDPYEGTGDAVNRIYYMGTEYANTNGGSGGSGEGYTETLLYQPQTAFGTGVITLSNNISNYDALIFRTKFNDGTRSESIVTSSEIEKVGYIANPSISSEHVLIKAYSGNYFRVVRGSETDDKVLNFFHVSGDELIYEIYGIKFEGGSGGGSSIIPNPEEEPTDTLNSVKIDGTVYNIESGSEGEGVEIYSEDEYIVGSLNINGVKKKIYQKTFVLNNITVTQSSGYSYDITSLGIEDVVESPRGFVKITNSDRRSIPFNLLSGYGFTATVKPNQILLERAGNDITISQAVVTIRYTKTVETDAPAWGGSVNNYYANFIDTDNVIDSGTYTSTFSYTATEDCYVNVALINNSNNDAQITIDGAVINYIWSSNGITNYQTLPLKKGQTLVATSSAGNALDYAIYGITYASGGSSSGNSVHYSTTEQVIGTWLNNKPLYQKTYENLNIGTVQNYTLTLSDLQNIEYLRVVPEGSQVFAMVPFPYVHYGTQNLIGYFIDSITDGVPTLAIRKGSDMSSQSNLQFLTIQYTKTTD